MTAQLRGFTLVAKIRQGQVTLGERMQGYKVLLFWIEASLAVLAGLLGILTLFWRDWIEAITGWSLDRHSGSAEFGLVAMLLITSISCAAVARRTHRRLMALSS